MCEPTTGERFGYSVRDGLQGRTDPFSRRPSGDPRWGSPIYNGQVKEEAHVEVPDHGDEEEEVGPVHEDACREVVEK